MFEEVPLLILQPLQGHRYRICEDYQYKDIVVPKDYITNGADIPRVFWCFIPPNMSDIMHAVVVHDYLCELEQYEKADKYFKELLDKTQLSKYKILIMHRAVVVYHYFENGEDNE